MGRVYFVPVKSSWISRLGLKIHLKSGWTPSQLAHKIFTILTRKKIIVSTT